MTNTIGKPPFQRLATGLSRRGFLAAGAGIGLVSAMPRTAFAAGKTLKVATYGGSWKDALEASIANGITTDGDAIEYVIGSANDNLAKVIAGRNQMRVPFDVMDGLPYIYQQAYDGGFIDTIDYSKISYKDNMPSDIFGEGQVVVEWTPDAFVYNSEKFAEAGIAPLESYSDLANPKLQGRVAFPNLGHPQHWVAVVGLAREHGGDEANLDIVPGLMEKINPSYYYTGSTELSSRFASGDIWVAPWGAGWGVRMKNGGIPAAVSYPRIGDKRGGLWPNIKWIIKGSENLDLVYKYIDLWLGVEGPAQFGIATGTVPANPEARKLMLNDETSRNMLLLTDEEIEMAYRVDWDRFNVDAWSDTWQRSVQR